MKKIPKLYQNALSNAPLAPMVRGLPLFGNALALGQDAVQFLLKSYQQHGSIFRIRLFSKTITVLAGKEANLFAQREGASYLSNQAVFKGLIQELGTEKNLANLEGEAHRLFRHTAHNGYSAHMMKQETALALDFAQDFIEKLPINGVFDVFKTLQKLSSLQLGKILTQLEGGDYINELQTFMNYLLYIHLTGVWPKAFMHLPAYKKAKARALEIANKIVTHHIENPPSETRAPNLIDDFLHAHQADPLAMPMDAVLAAALGPFLAGQDTLAATTAFMLYAIFSNPDVQARVQADVDRLFANGKPQAEDFHQAHALHLTAIETMRRYPVAPFMPQTASQSFEFNGYRVEANSPVYMAQSLTQFLPEYYDNPFQFNIDRPKGASGTMNPFGLGPHSCIGAGMAELLLMINIASILHYAKLEMIPSNYQLKFRAIPPAPSKFYLKILAKQNK